MNSESLPDSLILASTSKYRKLLLERLDLSFDCIAPATDESPIADEAPGSLVIRLAFQKAKAVSNQYPAAVVIGSDQVAVLGDQVLGKPGNHQTALKQLHACSSQTVEFLTSVSVQQKVKNFSEQYTDVTRVRFRKLTNTEIESYLRREMPYDCAGSFKSESLGVTLFEQVITDDPTALIGLPLIHTSALLRMAGFKLP